MSANEMIWQQKDYQLVTTWWVIMRMDGKHEKRLTTLKLWNLQITLPDTSVYFHDEFEKSHASQRWSLFDSLLYFYIKTQKSFLNDLYRCDFLQGECIFFYIKCYQSFVRDRVFRMWMRESLESIPSKLIRYVLNYYLVSKSIAERNFMLI